MAIATGLAVSHALVLFHPMQVRYQAAPRPDRERLAKQPAGELQIARNSPRRRSRCKLLLCSTHPFLGRVSCCAKSFVSFF
jgi:hypothetical protein